MKPRFAMAIAAAAALTSCIVAYRLLLRAPRYHGHGVPYWFHAQAGERAEAFRAMGSNAVPYLLNQLNYRDSAGIRFYRTNFAHLPAWLQRELPLPETESLRQVRAINVLGEMGWSARAAIPELIRAYTNSCARSVTGMRSTTSSAPNFQIGISALYAIPEIGGESDQIVPTILGATKYPASGSYVSMLALGRTNLAPAARSSRRLLFASLYDSDYYVRAAAVRMLAVIVPNDREATGHLLDLLGDEPTIRANAISSLSHTRDPSAIGDVAGKLTNIDPSVRSGAAEVLGRIGPSARMAIQKLGELALSANEPDADVRHSAAEALWSIDQQVEPVIPYRIADLWDKDDGVRWGAAGFLAWCGPHARAAVPALREMLHDKNERLRAKAAMALGAIGPEASGAIPELQIALKDEYLNVRDCAREALVKIQP